TIGGVERVVHELAKRQVAAGNDVLVASRRLDASAKTSYLIHEGVRYIKFPFVAFPFAVNGLVYRFNPEVVHVNSYLAAKFLRPRSQPVMLRHIHDVLGHSAGAYFGAKLGPIFPPIERYLVEGYSNYIVPSVSTKRKLQSSVNHGARIWVVPNGVDTSVFYPRKKGWLHAKLSLPEDEKLILFLGRLALGKGALEALRGSMPLLVERKASLVYIGPSETSLSSGQKPALGHILREARAAGVEQRVFRLGPQCDNDLASALSDCQVLVCPSTSEGFGLVVLEAASCGTPSVVYPAGSLPEVVENGVTGVVTDECTPSSLSAALEDLLSASGEAELRQMSLACTDKAKSYDWENTYTKLMKIYGSL
ncbi:MAG: glycosyltransferase family 4 protein, partial [Thermoprotei archaeon]